MALLVGSSGVSGPVVGDVDEQGIVAVKRPARGLEPAADVGPGRGRQLRPGDRGALEGDRRLQPGRQRTSLEQPEIGLRLCIAQRYVGRRIGAVAHVECHAIRRHAGADEQVVQRAQVQEVGLVVLLARPAAVDHQHMEPGHFWTTIGPTAGGLRCGTGEPAGADRQREQEQRGDLPAAAHCGDAGPHHGATLAAPRCRGKLWSCGLRRVGSGDPGLDAHRPAVRRRAMTKARERLSELGTERHGDRHRGEDSAGHQSFDHYRVEASQHVSPPRRWWHEVSLRSVFGVN